MSILKFAGLCILAGFICSSCASYRQNIMFRIPEGEDLRQQLVKAESNYTIQKNDLLQLEVYTNKGERIVDPSLASAQPSVTSAEGTKTRSYLVNERGMAKFPLLDTINIEGLTLRDAETVLEKAYLKYYEEPFVSLNFLNKRVIVLGAPEGQVIPLTNENMRLTEVLALAKGVGNESKVHNIRVLRGQEVFIADLSTIAGYHKYNIVMQPNDIVYVEPIRRPFIEGFRDYGPIISVITSLTTIGVIIWQANTGNNN